MSLFKLVSSCQKIAQRGRYCFRPAPLRAGLHVEGVQIAVLLLRELIDADAEEAKLSLRHLPVDLSRDVIEHRQLLPAAVRKARILPDHGRNKAALDAILATLDRTLIAQRAIEHPILGDINYSGEVEIVDVTYLQRSLAGIEVPFIINDFVADVDYDNNISILDASYIQRWLEGMDSVEGIGEPI